MKTSISYISGALLTSLTFCASAQQASTIETITIKGNNTPVATPFIAGSTSVINEQTIKASGAISITDLLRTVAGVNISQSGGLGSLSELRFRGSESNHVMVVLDGVELNDAAQGGAVDFSHILLNNIERIEVLRGPQSALWGSNAIAGVISISTKSAQSKRISPSVGLKLGDRQTYQANASVSQQLKSTSYSLNASTLKTSGENISRIGNEEDGYKNTSVGGKVTYKINQTNQVRFNGRLVNYESDFDSTDFSTGLLSDADNHTQGEQLSIGLDWHFTPQDPSEIYSQSLAFQYSDQSNKNYESDILGNTSEASKLRVHWNNHFSFGKQSFVNLGLEGVEEDFEQSGQVIFGDPNQSQSVGSYSFVSNGLYTLSDSLNLSASVRFDNNDTFDNASSYRVGSTYILNADWHAFVSYGKAVKNPTFTERFGYFPSSFLGNPDLRPEEQKSLEAGIEGRLDTISIQLSWFKAELKDEILGFVYEPISGQFTADNADIESEREGFEMAVNGSIQNIDYKAQYSYLDASENAQTELRRARHTGSVSVLYNVHSQHAVYLQADYTGARTDIFYPPFPAASQLLSLDAHWLVSANYQYKHNENITFSLRLSNLFNKQYEDVIGYSAESSRALAGLQYTW
jgi:vitamin B12 transporter